MDVTAPEQSIAPLASRRLSLACKRRNCVDPTVIRRLTRHR